MGIKIGIRNCVLRDIAVCRFSRIEAGKRQTMFGWHAGFGFSLIMKDGNIYKNTVK